MEANIPVAMEDNQHREDTVVCKDPGHYKAGVRDDGGRVVAVRLHQT